MGDLRGVLAEHETGLDAAWAAARGLGIGTPSYSTFADPFIEGMARQLRADFPEYRAQISQAERTIMRSPQMKRQLYEGYSTDAGAGRMDSNLTWLNRQEFDPAQERRLMEALSSNPSAFVSRLSTNNFRGYITRTVGDPAPAPAARRPAPERTTTRRTTTSEDRRPEPAEVAAAPVAAEAPPPPPEPELTPLQEAVETAETDAVGAGRQFIDALIADQPMDFFTDPSRTAAQVSALQANEGLMEEVGNYLKNNSEEMEEDFASGLISIPTLMQEHPQLAGPALHLMAADNPEGVFAVLGAGLGDLPAPIQETLGNILLDEQYQTQIIANLQDPEKAQLYVDNLSSMMGMAGGNLSDEHAAAIAQNISERPDVWIRILGEPNFLSMTGNGQAQLLLGDVARDIQREMTGLGNLLGDFNLEGIPFLGDMLSGLGDIDFAGMAQEAIGGFSEWMRVMGDAMGLTQEAVAIGNMDLSTQYGTFMAAREIYDGRSFDDPDRNLRVVRLDENTGRALPPTEQPYGPGNRRMDQPIPSIDPNTDPQGPAFSGGGTLV